MLKKLARYTSSLSILIGIIIGGTLGLLSNDLATSLKPIGDLFLNFMFITIVPLVFFSITHAVIDTAHGDRLRRILLSALVVFLITALIAALLGYFGFILYDPLANIELATLLDNHELAAPLEQQRPLAELLVNTLSASDFLNLFRRDNLLALIIFALILGVAIRTAGDKGEPLAKLIVAGNAVILRLITMIMYFAPVGLGAYFAGMIGDLGSQIMGAYGQTFLLYLLLTALLFFGANTLYAYLAAGSLGVHIFWKNILTPALTALTTASSAASIPANLLAARAMKIPHDVAEATIPLGANTHKDGSVIGGVFKILFLFSLFNLDPTGIELFFAIIAVALLVGIVIGAIPSGGLTAEVMICTLFGFPIEYVGVILVISIIIDIPATLLNSVGNLSCAMLVARLTEGRNWLKKEYNKNKQIIVSSSSN